MALFDLSGRVALVSGGASGMGRSMSLALAEHGADLMLVDLNTEGVQRTAGEIEKLGRRAIAATCDVSDFAAIEKLFEQLDREFGRIDFSANVAGEGILAKPEEITQEQVQQVFQNLVFGRLRMCQEAGKRMLKAYSMAMGAVIQMTRELSTEWASRGVRVNSILPAQVMNPSLEKRIAADPSIRDRWLSGIPRGRMGQPTDIQGLAVLLASDASSWITGAIIPMDGGNLAVNAGGTIGK
jgi:NAD(P)-dependent dehydrogenase (short-subunit alcohol dehydrogenase family)